MKSFLLIGTRTLLWLSYTSQGPRPEAVLPLTPSPSAAHPRLVSCKLDKYKPLGQMQKQKREGKTCVWVTL
uniref:Secreted protein n=2 Tax=Cercopithecinae TaxID=9528 RepID=A0A2K5XYX2_MANLE|nr:unnamed protein product [Macaca fascicularis]